ncbi:hypothetical protein G6F47_011917 [Rhizopus delemar]|nr:hypothetical protein G6F52_009963 [Rhizopus delemar]KAG1583693.1 hypothetical protein G6F47_011917 [Rhizopus delemar]
MANQPYSNNYLNTLRSAIASVFSVIHETKPPIAGHKPIKDFFTDITILLQHIQNTMSPTCNLSLQHQQLKTILLLCIATTWRPRSDIGCLQHRDITINNDHKGEIQAIIHTRTPKEAQVKSITLDTYQDQQLCPVQTLQSCLNKTSQYRTNLPEDHTLFLTYLEQEDKKSSSVCPSTIANWTKSAMQDAGIDTKHFQAHSIRSASSTKAVELGHSIQDLKKHANWSLNSNTFEKFYYKPSLRVSSSAAINHSIFSSTDNSITLEVGVESAGISLGTTSNTNVDKTKTENTPTPAHSSSVGKRKQTYDDQSNPTHVKKNKKAFVFTPLTLTPSISINKPNIDDVDATLLDQHYYAKLTDSHVADGIHGCVETDAEYAKNMDDQCPNQSLGSLKVAMKFLENALDQPLSKLLDYIWSYNCDTNTPVEDIEAIRLAKYILSDFHANCMKPQPLALTNKYTPFCESILPIFKYFSAATGILSFIWCEKASATCKQLGIYHPGIGSKLFDGLGTSTKDKVDRLLIECSCQQDTPLNQEDFLKLLECTNACLQLDMMKYRYASLTTFKRR